MPIIKFSYPEIPGNSKENRRPWNANTRSRKAEKAKAGHGAMIAARRFMPLMTGSAKVATIPKNCRADGFAKST